MSIRVWPALVCCAVGSAACNDFDTPPELARPSVLTVLVDPPAPALGETAELTIVAAGPDGLITVPSAQWTLISTYPNVPPMGTIAGATDRATYTAPTELPALPDNALPIDTVQILAWVGTRELAVVKAVGVRTPEQPAVTNPQITSLMVDGTDVLNRTDGITTSVGATLDLQVMATTLGDTRVAWYATVGTIEQYQSTPTEIMFDEPGTGTLIAVLRDTVGSDYVAVPLTVNP